MIITVTLLVYLHLLRINIHLFQVNYDAFQDTADKPLDLNPETPDPFRYLTINSTYRTTEINGKNSMKSIDNLNCCFNKTKTINCVFCYTDFPMDCSDVFKRGQRTSGIYPIKPNQSEPFYVYCEISSGKRPILHI